MARKKKPYMPAGSARQQFRALENYEPPDSADELDARQTRRAMKKRKAKKGATGD